MTGRLDILRQPPLELALLLSAIGEAEAADRQAGIQRLASAMQDWDRLLELASRHHVAPLLYRGLHDAAWRLVPSQVQNRLSALFAANLKRNLLLARHAVTVLQAFKAAGIPVLPHKGVFIAQSVYGQLSSREVNDIDLLIGANDAARARQVLAALNFEPMHTLDQEQVFRQQQWKIEIDLHWQVSPGLFAVSYDFPGLLQRSVSEQLAGQDYRAPAREDLLLLLCIQLAKDCWERRQRLVHLQKVCDIAAVIARTPVLGWAEVQSVAARQGLTRVLHFSLALAAGLLGAAVPIDVADRMLADRTALSLARRACALPELADTMLPPEANPLLDIPLRLRQLVFYLRLRELQKDKFRHLGRVMAEIPAALIRRQK